MVIWIIGMSGSGKTTIGGRLAARLKKTHPNLVFLDGDILRDVWGDWLGHDIAGRRVNAHRISHLCRVLDLQKIHIVAAVLSIFPEWQRWNRENFSRYFEVFLDVPMQVLQARDPKALYRRAFAGEIQNVVGVDIPFPRVEHPDLVLDNATDLTDVEPLVERVLTVLPPLEVE
jgi:adenylylsulfate kinase